MNRRAWMAGLVVLALTAAATAFLATQQARQKLGRPGLRIVAEPMFATEIPPSTNPPVLISSNRVFLPPQVLDYRSESGNTPTITVKTLPKDTLFGHRTYLRKDDSLIDCQVVLMGQDRSSIHKPQFCLVGSGFTITASDPVPVRITRPHAYDLPVMRLKLFRQGQDADGRPRAQGGVFVYWFVADGELTSSHWDRMWWIARDLLTTGVLQRWAYVICFAPCEPGAEDATFEQMKEFIADAVPEFHVTTGVARPLQTAEPSVRP